MPVSLSSNWRWGVLVLGLAVTACTDASDVDRPGTWQASRVNDQNLRAMIVDPRDLSSGAAATTDRGNAAARAVTRLYTDRRRQLLDVSTSTVAPAQTTTDSAAPASSGSGVSQ
jgi:hypothetical protein